MLRRIAELTGRRPPQFEVPRAVVWPIAFGAELVAHVTGREPFATIDGLRMAKKKMYFSSAKAEAELGYRHRPARDGLADAIAWFRQAGYCP
jgi:dihydroflavonol-4-reductase